MARAAMARALLPSGMDVNGTTEITNTGVLGGTTNTTASSFSTTINNRTASSSIRQIYLKSLLTAFIMVFLPLVWISYSITSYSNKVNTVKAGLARSVELEQRRVALKRLEKLRGKMAREFDESGAATTDGGVNTFRIVNGEMLYQDGTQQHAIDGGTKRVLFHDYHNIVSTQQHFSQQQYVQVRHPTMIGYSYHYTEGTKNTKQILHDIPQPNIQFLSSQQTSNANSTESIPSLRSSEATPVQSSWYQPNAYDYLPNGHECEPQYQWQVGTNVNCNTFHELNLLQMRMINKGGSRIAFEMKQHLNTGGGSIEEAKFVYKTIKYSNEVDMHMVEQQRKDALVMERTTKSRFIPELYGYCSVGVMMDFMPEGNMHDYIKGARLSGGSTLPAVDKLRISIHIASSVADLHETGEDESVPAFYHNDSEFSG